MSRIGKGYTVKQDDRGRAVIEKIPYYGMDASAKIKAKKGKRVRVQRPQLNFSPARGS